MKIVEIGNSIESFEMKGGMIDKIFDVIKNYLDFSDNDYHNS